MSFLFVSLDKICQLCLYCRNLLICRFAGGPCHIDAVTLASGNQVDMKMEHCLSGNGAVILQNIHIGEAKHFLHGSCQLCRLCVRSACLRRVDFKDIWHMVFGQDQCMPLAGRKSVQNYLKFIIFVYGCRRNFSCNDFAKNTVAHRYLPFFGVIFLYHNTKK